MELHSFYATNTHHGVVTLAPTLFDWSQSKDVLLLKGGAGFGKTTFLKTMGETLQKAGIGVEFLWCAGHPHDLDGIIAPQLHCAALDATAPHMLEPLCPGGVERWVDLGQFCDVTAAKELANQTKRLLLTEQSDRTAAHHTLRAAHNLEQAITAQVMPTFDISRAQNRVDGILKRSLTKGREKGVVQQRFLSSFTALGLVHHWEHVLTCCPTVYGFCDRYHLGRDCLAQIAQGIQGWNCIVCMDAVDSQRMVHLLIPDLGVAFVTTSPHTVFPGTLYRQVHLDTLAHPKDKGRLRLQERLIQQLYQQAQTELSQAQKAYQQRSALLTPYLDSQHLTLLATLEANRWLSDQETNNHPRHR